MAMALRSISADAFRAAVVRVAPAAVLLALVLAVGAFEPSFLSRYSLVVLMGESSPILLLAIAQTTVIMLGGIDLSVAAIASLASVLLALVLPTLGVWGLLAVLLLATVIGSAQGYIHVMAQIPSFVVTLAGMGLWSGIALAIAHTSIPVDEGYAVVGWMEGSLLGVPVAFIFGAGAALLVWAALRWSPMGRYVKAIGLGETAALLSGVPVGWVKVIAFGLSGLFAGLTGMALVARTYSGSPSAATNFLLPSIAAVVIGGTAITGGFGSLVRTVIGVLIVTVLRVGIAVIGVDPGYEPLCYGLVVVCAVALTLDRSRLSVVK
jgi:ribose transport system permease protein